MKKAYQLPTDERALLNAYRRLTDENRGHALRVMQALAAYRHRLSAGTQGGDK